MNWILRFYDKTDLYDSEMKIVVNEKVFNQSSGKIKIKFKIKNYKNNLIILLLLVVLRLFLVFISWIRTNNYARLHKQKESLNVK